MRISWKAVGATWAIVLALGLNAGAVPVTTGQQMVDGINNALPGDVLVFDLDAASSPYLLPAPLVIDSKKNVSIIAPGAPTLPNRVVIQQGAPAPGDCFGNAVKNGNFDTSPDASWTQATPSPPAIITNNAAEANSGNYYALFNRAPAVSTSGVPDGITRFTRDAALDLSKFPMPGPITETYTWRATIPPKKTPFPVTLTNASQMAFSALNSYAESVKLYSPLYTDVHPSAVTLWVWAPSYQAPDSLVMTDNNLSVGTTAVLDSINGANVGAYAGGYFPWVVDLSGISTGDQHNITLTANLGNMSADPTIFLIGAVEVRPNSVVSPVPGGTAIDPGAFAAGVTTGLPPPYHDPPPRTVPANPYGFSSLRFGGVGWPRMTFSAAMPRVGDPGDSVEPIFIDTSGNPPIHLGVFGSATLGAACQTEVVDLPPVVADIQGKVGFWVNINVNVPNPSIFVVDDVVVTIVSARLESISPIFAAGANNVMSADNPNFDSGSANWDLGPQPPPFTLTANDVMGTGCNGGTSAVFDPANMSIPPINLYVWARVLAPGATLDVTVGADPSISVLTGGEAVTPDFAMVPAGIDVTKYANGPVSVVFKATSDPNTLAPGLFVLGTVEADNMGTPPVGPLPDAGQEQDLAGGSYQEDAGAIAAGVTPTAVWPGTAVLSYPTLVRFGGIHQPSLNYQISAPAKAGAGDTLSLYFNGTNYPFLSESDVTGPCQDGPELSLTALLGNSGTFGFDSKIAPAVVPNPSTVFELDNLCIGCLSGALNAAFPNNFAKCDKPQLFEDFDGGGSGNWTGQSIFNTNVPVIGSSTAVPPCNATRLAVFKELPPPAVTEVTLTQAVTRVPYGATELKFVLKTPTVSGLLFDSFEYKMVSGANTATGTETVPAVLGATYQPRTLTIDPALFGGQAAVITFTAKLADSATPTSFAIDDVCLAQPPGQAALITVAGSQSHLVISDLTVQGSSADPAIATNPGDVVTVFMHRCLVERAAVGLDIGMSGVATLDSCVFSGNATGIRNAGGNVTVFQNTILDGSTAVAANSGTTNVAACLFDRNGGVSGSANSYLNWISGGQGTVVAGFPNLPAVPAPIYDGRWTGSLTTPLTSTRAYADLPGGAKTVTWDKDFEGQIRSATGNLQAGADEVVVGLSTITSWTYQFVDAQGNILPPPVVTGPTTPVRIVVTIVGSDITNDILELHLIPEVIRNAPAVTPYIVVPLNVDSPTTASGTIAFSTPFDQATGNCTDGWPGFILVQNGTDVPTGMQDTPELIIDTVPPELVLVTNSALGRLAPDITANDNTTTDPAPPPGPVPPLQPPATGNWPGGTNIPWSSLVGSLADKDQHWFIGPIPLTDPNLVIQVHAQFVERRPTDANGTYNVTTSGFDQDTAPMISTSAGLPSGTLATLTAGPSDMLDVIWEFTESGFGSWAFLPGAQDRALNRAEVLDPLFGAYKTLDHSMHAWYSRRPTALFASGSTTAGQQTSNPQFYWSLDPSTGLLQDDERPCYPLVFFQIWAIDPVTMAGQSLNGGWFWSTGPIGMTSLVNSSGQTLQQLLKINQATQAQSHMLLIAILGADEAGTIQNHASDAPADFVGEDVDTRIWMNSQNQSVGVDTDLNVSLAHAAANGAIITGRDFGSMARVPLPSQGEAALGAYVQATATMTAHYPAQTIANGVRVEWKLYEEGALVAQGKAEPVSPNTPMQFVMPELLRTPYQNAFVVVDFPTCKVTLDPATKWDAFLHANRYLGDTTARQREIHYTLVAQTVAIINGLTSTQEIADTTSAPVDFSIYVREMLDKVREEQPVRIYERGTIK